MFSRYSVLASLASIVTLNPAYAWYGPLCYSDSVREITITQPSISGETAGDLRVSFDDNLGHVKLVAVRASATVKGAHEIVLSREKASTIGVFGLVFTSPRSTVGYKYELEFRKDPSECAGMIIKTALDRNAWDPAAGPRPSRPKPARKAKAVEAAAVPAEQMSPGGEAAALPAPAGSTGPASGDPASPATDDLTEKGENSP